MRRLEIRGIDEGLLKGYLVAEFGATEGGEGTVAGEGWLARFVRGEPIRIGLVMTPVLFVEFEGERAEGPARFLARQAMRGGG